MFSSLRSNKNKLTIIKFDVSNGCCTSQADKDFVMDVNTFTVKQAYEYLYQETKDLFKIDEKDNEEVSIIINGITKAIDTGHLCIKSGCMCGLTYFIIKDKLQVKSYDLLAEENNYKTIDDLFEF